MFLNRPVKNIFRTLGIISFISVFVYFLGYPAYIWLISRNQNFDFAHYIEKIIYLIIEGLIFNVIADIINTKLLNDKYKNKLNEIEKKERFNADIKLDKIDWGD